MNTFDESIDNMAIQDFDNLMHQITICPDEAERLSKKEELTIENLQYIAKIYGLLGLTFQCRKYLKLLNDDNYFEKKDYDDIIDLQDNLIEKHNNVPKYRLEHFSDIPTYLLAKQYEDVEYILNKKYNVYKRWNFDAVDSLFVDLHIKTADDVKKQELGLFLVFLPIILYYKKTYNIKKIIISVGPKLNNFLKKYFPDIINVPLEEYRDKVVPIEKVSVYSLYIDLFKNTNVNQILKDSIRNISKVILKDVPKKTNKLGILWYSNSIGNQHKSIPIGTLINTVGNNKKNINVKCLQYNDPKEEIDLFNKYSKNKFVDIFYNDYNTDICDIIDAVSDCKAVIGTSNVILISNILGIPSLLTGSTPHHHWYAFSGVLPYVTPTEMKFVGDYEGLYNSIYSHIDEHFD